MSPSPVATILLSALFVRYRDVQPIWDVGSQMLFYASPILYVATQVPADWQGQRVLLHFGAVDYEASIMVNGSLVGTHRGGRALDELTDAGALTRLLPEMQHRADLYDLIDYEQYNHFDTSVFNFTITKE